MESSFAWLDFSAKERENVLEVVKLLSQPESRDEMGIGVIRDRIADILFPGTSTIHTRLKYFLYVPWIFQELDRAVKQGRMDSQAAKHFIRQKEETLLKQLKKADDTTGVIGVNAGTNVGTMPSEIYWGGMGVWGIRKFKGSRYDYFRDIPLFVGDNPDEDDEEKADEGNSRWDSSLPHIDKPEYSYDMTIQLTNEEAHYFQKLFSTPPKDSLIENSLLAHLMLHGQAIDVKATFPWKIEIETLPENLRDDLRHAQNFSEVMNGVTLYYNLLLAQTRDDSDLIERYTKQIQCWYYEINQRPELKEWAKNIDGFWHHLKLDKARLSLTSPFVEEWLKFIFDDETFTNLCNHPQGLRTHPLGQFIRNREKGLKKSRARLDNSAMLQQWSGASALAPLNYRWNTAKNYVNEIATALRPPDVTTE